MNDLEKRYAEAKERQAKATPGPWTADYKHVLNEAMRVVIAYCRPLPIREPLPDEANATFIAAHHDDMTLLDEAMARIGELEKDAALGRLVRQKMLSGNNVSVERCVIRDEEIAAIDAARGES